MVHGTSGELAIALHTAAPPSRDEWDEWMQALRSIPAQRLSVLAVTDGGGPNTVQRSEFIKYLKGARIRIAVVSDALIVRGIVTAISWFTDGIRLFSPDAFADAASHLELSSEQIDAVRTKIKAMAAALGATPRAMRGA
jgi:hypothetical protein